MELQGKTAVITGAGNGIGRALALALARRKCAVAVVDIDRDGLAETKRLLAENGAQISAHLLDVADRAAVAALPQAILDAQGKVDILANNAGVALGGTFEEVSEADFDWLFEINFHALVRMTRAFLPLLRARPEAQIVNLSSLFGLVSLPGQAAYCASKFAVRGFSNALRAELEGTSVGVTVVHPGGVATAIARHARVPAGADPAEVAARVAEFEKKLKMSPDKAAENIVAALQKRRPRVIVGSDAVIVAALERIFPVFYQNILARLD